MSTISVVTAVDPGRADYIKSTYGSLVEQVLPNGWEWQWLVQQDGPGQVRDLLPDEPRISFHYGRRGGPATARNMALARADGELIRVLDADDELARGALGRDIDVLTSDPAIDWTTSRVLDILPDGSTVGFDFDPPEGLIAVGDVLRHWQEHDYRAQVHPATLCMRRDLLIALGGWMALPASEDTGLLLALNAMSLGYFIAEPGLLYRKWPGQSTASSNHSEPSERRARMWLIEARALMPMRRPPTTILASSK